MATSDVASFGSLQALPSFLNQFGELQDDGSYALSTTRRSIMNSGWSPVGSERDVLNLTNGVRSELDGEASRLCYF